MSTQVKYVVTVNADYSGGVSSTFLDQDGWTDEVAVSFATALEAVAFFAGKVTVEKFAVDTTDQVLDMTTTPPSFH